MFRVEWLLSAQDELGRLWQSLPVSELIPVTDALRQLDRDLLLNANTVGESRSGTLRIHFIDPLGFLFDIDSTANVVTVISVWRTR